MAAAAAARTDAARSAAQADIAKARTALTNAVNAAKALAAPSGDPERIGERAILVDAAEEAQTQDLASLRRAEAGTGWAGDVVATEIDFHPAVEVNRRLRKDSEGDDADTLLKAADIPARMYSAGKTVMGGDLGSSGERLQMRGFPILQVGRPPGNNLLMYRAANSATDNDALVAENLAALQNKPDLLAGLAIKPDGLEIEMGGKGAPGLDFRFDSVAKTYQNSLAIIPGRTDAGSDNGYDLSLNFGRPDTSPQGSAGHYWKAALMPTAAIVTAAGGDTGWLKDGYRTRPLGVYEVRLSNHIGFDANQEDPDADEPYTADDENHYLTYAAYGFMDFYRPGTTYATASVEHSYHRVFPFHVGYDAFKDEAGMRTTDIGDAAVTSGTFKGRTMAVRFQAQDRSAVNVTPEVATRMRGDIQLTATISGTQASNTITAGTISNMEDWDSKGYWEASSIIPPGTPIRFGTDGTIDAKGEFTGTFANYPAGYSKGGYRGNFYGPKESLEAAGTWVMAPPTAVSADADYWWAIVGSFGAALVRDDGTYGRVVQGAEASASD